MKRIEDRQLARLGSVKDLQAAKRRVNRAIREMEESVKDDYEAALEAFSWRDVICYGFSVLDSVQSVVRYMGKGLYTGMTSGIVNGLRRRREKRLLENRAAHDGRRSYSGREASGVRSMNVPPMLPCVFGAPTKRCLYSNPASIRVIICSIMASSPPWEGS